MDTVFPNQHAETLALIQRLVDLAQPITLGHFRDDPDTETKQSGREYDPVTVADRDAETAIRAELAKARPTDAIVGEEHGTQDGTSGWTWYLDPIDGTRAYVAGLTSWTTLIGLAGP